MEVRRDPKSFLFFIILLLLINSPEPQQQSFTSRSRYDEIIVHEWNELEVVNRTRYGDFDASKDKWLNITGLKDEDGFAWDLLGPVQERVKDQARGLLGVTADAAFDGTLEDQQSVPVYRNVSGYVQGEWVRSPLGRVRHPSDMNLSAIVPDNPFPMVEYERNLTGTSGMIRLYITETDGRMRTDKNRSISEITVRMVIGDNNSIGGNWWELVLNGVHFPKFGGSLVTTTSDKFAGIFALPHFSLSQHLYSESQNFLNRTIHETIDRQEGRAYPTWNPWTSAPDGASEGMLANPHCEFVLFLQEHPIQYLVKQEQNPENRLPDMDWLEHELRYPTGSTLPRRSPLSLSMVGFSPDCGFVIESKGPPDYSHEFAHLVGSKTEEFNDRARHGIIAFAMTLSLQLILLVKQMKETATPSTRNRISFYTIAMLALGDGFAFLALIFMHLFLGTSQLALYTTAFLALFLGVFELRFLMDIWTVQATEQMRQDRQQASAATPSSPQQPSSTPTPPPTTQISDSLPPPVTAARPPPIASDQDDTAGTAPAPAGEQTQTVPGRAELGTLYSRYCLLLICIFFVTLQFTTVRFTVRSFYFNTLSFFYLSFWCPQIYRNIMRNCRKALRWDFVLGQSIVRLIPITYFYAVSDNVLFSRNDLSALMVLAGWVWVQILALASQELLGSRFFIREGWAPPAYDYHPVLREDEEGATMPIGSTQAPDDDSSPSSMSKAGESKGKGTKVFDCSICTQDVEVLVLPSGASSENAPGLGGMILQRRAYMVTPCRHIFHTPCLEGWMRYRLQCPNCREILPPL
ncbi:uncharacterized protein BDR25DRAFT_304071 [Lindgomyces ingoldianus]|uniref:Uncharacterized protein n=1 Tax=Lindgomyces ingoldianus TaxID=673940 RepID=A0ACB6QVK7_9PLEO|nr:uncharacterized protein BDR25DRAFT_304071 [Lindgomyces ingoldianus]KAF2470107.1 hypothetical protein BDR25DRAFT_304071 [Lindgomyces ingoldianus]